MRSMKESQNLIKNQHFPCNMHIHKHDKMGGRNEDVTNIEALVPFLSKEKPLWFDCKTAHMDFSFNKVTWLMDLFFFLLFCNK